MKPLTAILMLFAPLTAHAQDISGSAKALDGDTLEVAGTTVRLLGIDAPEAAQTCLRQGVAWRCGQDAGDLLTTLVKDRAITCSAQDTDQYGRTVAICRAGYVDLGRAMVDAGLAVALPQYSQAYVVAEERTRARGVGIWASRFDQPAQYRAAHPRVATARPRARAAAARATTKPSRAAQSPSHGGRCDIKGNRNRRGQWIYHLPGMPYYDATRPEEVFCTEQQAIAAGYRRAVVKP